MNRGQTQLPTSRPIGEYSFRKPEYHIRHQQPSRLPTLLETTYQDDSGYGNSVPSSRIFNSYEFPAADTYNKPKRALSPRTNTVTTFHPEAHGQRRFDQRVKFDSKVEFPEDRASRVTNPPQYSGLLAIKNPSLEQTWPLHASSSHPSGRYNQPLSLDLRAPRHSRHRREVSFADELEVELPPRAKSFQESAVPSIWRDGPGTISPTSRTRMEVPTFATHYRYMSGRDVTLDNTGYFQPAELGLPLLQPQHINRRINVNVRQDRRIPTEDSGRNMEQPRGMTAGYHANTSKESNCETAKEDLRVHQIPDQDFLPDYRVVDSSPVSTLLSPSNALQDLSSVDQFALFEISTSALGWAEMFMGASWLDQTQQYKFVVLDRHEELLYIGVEESSCISDCVVSPYRSSFKVRILDASGRDVIQFHRVYPVKPIRAFGFGQKRKYRLEVSSPPGQVIGNVEKTYDSDNYYLLEDKTGDTVFLVQRSCICTCPIFWDYEFKVLLPDTDAEVGDVSWSYLSAHDEQLNGTEISFPVDLDPNSKIMLLGACFLLNFGRWPSSYLESIYSPRKNSKQRRENSHQGRKEDRPDG